MPPNFFESLVESTDQLVFCAKAGTTLIYANTAFSSALGLGESLADDISLVSLVAPDYAGEFKNLFRQTIDGDGTGRFETAMKRGDDEILHLEGSLSLVPGDEPVVIGVFADFTHRKRAEDVLARQATELLKASESLDRRDQEISEALEQAQKYQDALTRAQELSRINAELEEEVERRSEAEQTLLTSLREKEVLLKEIHHRVKNNMQVISSLLNLQRGKVEDVETRKLFEDSQSRIRSMALIHEQLYQSEDLASVDFGDYIDNLAHGIFRSYASQAAQIRLETEVAQLSLPLDQAIPCGLIINELVCNALKYAFNGQKGRITISLTESDTGYQLVVADDGAGIPKDLDIKSATTLGLRLVKTLVDQIDGELVVDATQGTRFQISFPPLTS